MLGGGGQYAGGIGKGLFAVADGGSAAVAVLRMLPPQLVRSLLLMLPLPLLLGALLLVLLKRPLGVQLLLRRPHQIQQQCLLMLHL